MKLLYTLLDQGRQDSCESEVIRIGRAPEVEIQLDHEFISRYHAEIRQESGRMVIVDLTSDNGTFVNGDKISAPTALHIGDRVRLGDPGPEILIDRLDAAAETMLPPANPAPHCVGNYPPPFGPKLTAGNEPDVRPANPAPMNVLAREPKPGGVARQSRSPRVIQLAVIGLLVIVAAGLTLVSVYTWRDQPGSLASLFEEVAPATVKLHVIRDDGQEGSGSGFFVDRRGWLVTNFHVAARAKNMEAELDDGTKLPVEGVIADSAIEDIAILKVDLPPARVRVLPLYNDDEVLPPAGTEVCVVGHPLGLNKSLTPGTISSPPMTGRQFRAWLEEHHAQSDNPLVNLHFRDNMTWLQTNAAVSQGNSGGPLLNRRGEVIGVTTWGISGEAAESMNFASAVKHLRRLINDADGTVRPLSDLTPSSEN